MNVLLMSRIIAKTGVGNHIKQLSEELTRQGHRIWVISSTNEMNIGGGGTDITYVQVDLRTKNIGRAIKNLWEIHQVISGNQIDIVHCHHRMAALYMKLYNFIWKMPYVWTLHLAPIPCGFFHRMFTAYGDRAIAISKEVGDFLNKNLRVPQNDISYVLNGVDESKLLPLKSDEKAYLKQKMGIPFDKKVFALHSRIDAVKNHYAVVEAVATLSQKERGKLVVICSGEKCGDYYERVIEKIRKENLEDNFVFCGWVNAADILGVADVMLLPSLAEGFALNCIEAMFMNVPAIRTKTGGYEDMKDYCIGMEDATSKTIARYIRNVLNGSLDMSEKVYKANEFVNNQCTLSVMTRNTVKVYKDVLER